MKKLALLALTIGLSSATALAWDGPPQTLGAALGNLIRPTSYVDGNIFGLFGNTPYSDSRFRLNIVAFDDDKNTVQLNGLGQRFHLDEDLPLGGTNSTVPRDLWTTNVGATYSHKLEHGDWGAIVSVGSASDLPFHSLQEDTISVTGTYRHEVDPLHSWIFFLNYATNRAFAPNVPLPGVAYLVVNPDAHTVISWGLPFFIAWQPDKDWSFHALYFIPTLISTQVEYQFHEPLKLHLGFDWMPQTWLPANRPTDTDRLILDQMKLSLGLKSPLGQDAYFDLITGFAFDQQIFEAESLFSSGVTKTSISAAAFVQGEIAYKF
jgi:hypothetical protein